MLFRVHFSWARFERTTLAVIGTDCIGSCKSNYHTITVTTAPSKKRYWYMYSVYIMLMYLTKLETYEYENNSISIKRTVHGH